MDLVKPDGREMALYSRWPISSAITAVNPKHEPITSMPHLRWHPLRGEWVAYATHRQNRTFLPPKEYNPLAPSSSKEFPTELPVGEYDVAVFENLFTSLNPRAREAPKEYVPTRAGRGTTEVVVFTQASDQSLGRLPLSHIELILKVWADRTREISKNPEIQYVMPFENRGVEVGVTLHHPHGQIYAYPFVPPVPAKMQETQRRYFQENNRGLLQDTLEQERAFRGRIVVEENEVTAFIPAFARYPYEVWIAPNRAVPDLSSLTAGEIHSLARVLKTVLLKYDGLWERTFPYLMVLYQAPTDGQAHPEFHFHIEFYPPYRSRDRLKYLAGTELGAGLFVNDTLPEEKAQELRHVEVSESLGDL
jgi:UDPglucose--hexose-1-phosphate uridylyltransferase